MKWQNVNLRIVSLLIFISIATMLISQIVDNELIKKFLEGLAPSILSSIILYIYIEQIDVKKLLQDEQIKEILKMILEDVDNKNFNKVGLNREMGSEYWNNHIEALSATKETAWFVGGKMSLWLETTYKTELGKQLKSRFINVYENYSDDEYKTYIFISDKKYIKQWKSFIEELKDTIIKDKKVTNTEYIEKLNNAIKIIKLKEKDLKYSLVKIGNKISLSTRTLSNGRDGDSPTLNMYSETSAGKCFYDDLIFLAKKYKVS